MSTWAALPALVAATAAAAAAATAAEKERQFCYSLKHPHHRPLLYVLERLSARNCFEDF